MTELVHKNGRVEIRPLPDGRNAVSIRLSDPREFTPSPSCETTYPCDLIEAILNAKGPAYVCDEILRDQSPQYVESGLRNDIFGYITPEALRGKRLLDFGCGCGASTVILARMIPEADIVGVELVPAYAETARRRAAHYGLQNVDIRTSPSGQQLPDGIGTVDFILLSAVYEHLFPIERKTLLPALWSVLKPGGVMFLNSTPYRWAPVESHTTNLPFINYLPARLTHFAATRLSQRMLRNDSWETLLRKGIRGGSERQIIAELCAAGEEAVLLEPTCAPGVRDRIDLWFSVSSQSRFPAAKRTLRWALKGIKALSGAVIVPWLSLAFQKPAKGIPPA